MFHTSFAPHGLRLMTRVVGIARELIHHRRPPSPGGYGVAGKAGGVSERKEGRPRGELRAGLPAKALATEGSSRHARDSVARGAW